MLIKFWQIVMILVLAISTFAQTDSNIEEKNLETYFNGNYSGQKQFILPFVIGRFLPKSLLIKRKERLDSTFREKRLISFVKRLKFLKASEYSTSKISDRLWFPCIEFKNRIYVFAGHHFKTGADAVIFNLFLKETNLKIENESEAAELANLFFATTRGYFENNGKLILSSVEDVPLSYRKDKEVEAQRLQKIVTSPKTELIEGNYEVELFTWEMALGEVKKWNFKIQSDAQIEVESAIIGKL